MLGFTFIAVSLIVPATIVSGTLLSCKPETNHTYLHELYMDQLDSCTDPSIYGVLPYTQLALLKQHLDPVMHQCHHINHPESGACDPNKQTNCVDCQILFDEINTNNKIPCPSMSWKPDSKALVNQKSACPWHYRIVQSQTRYPSFLGEAVCTCENCRVGDGNDPTMECVPVTHNVPLLTAIDELSPDGVHCVYKMKLVPLAAGCTCALKRANLKHRSEAVQIGSV